VKDLSFAVSVRSSDRILAAVRHFSLAPEKITFLFGESGIGKSIICKALYGLLDPKDLTVRINDLPYTEYINQVWVKAVKKSSFFVFQEPSTHLNPQQKISEQLREGSLQDSREEGEILGELWQNDPRQSLQNILDVFPKPYRPSGGEKQRVLLAMAFKKLELLLRSEFEGLPTCYVFDEPTGSLDNQYRNIFLKILLQKYRQHHFSAIIITHDYSIISEIYNQHQDLLDHICLMELSRKNDAELDMHAFSAENYLDWLKATKPFHTSPEGRVPVLRVGSRFSVFGRSLTLTRHQGEPEDLVVRTGEMAYLKAASGVGKTTLAKIIMGLYTPDSVEMEISSLPITERTRRDLWPRKIWGQRAGMVFQHADEALNLAATVRQVFRGLPVRGVLNDDSIKSRLTGLLNHPVDDDFLNKKVEWLSGGQKQCLNLLRTFSTKPDLIILDEPLNGLDFNRIQRVLALIREACQAGSAILIITHNEEIMDHLVAPEQVWYLS
jgi:ABC-type glutathione transport system ATPase component